MVNRSREERRQEALKLLNGLPEAFRWNNVNGPIMKRDEIIKEVEAGSKIGDDFIDLIEGLVPNNNPSYMGKRYVCLVCWTEVLSTKEGNGGSNVACHGQNMWLKQPRFIPSAD